MSRSSMTLIWRCSLKRFNTMKYAPSIQYAISREAGGRITAVTMYHPRQNRSGLLIDSLNTST